MSRATRDTAAAAEIRFVYQTYATKEATAFALRNADRVTSLGGYGAPDVASIHPYSQLQDLVLDLEEIEGEEVVLLPCALTKVALFLQGMNINWEDFRPLGRLQELQIYNQSGRSGFKVQLDDSFATALPLLRVFHVHPGVRVALETTAKVVMPHLVKLDISQVNMVHLDVHFMSALKSLNLHDCTISTVSAASSTMVLHVCWMRKGTVLVAPNLWLLRILWGGLTKLDGSKCRHALSIVCRGSSIEWVGAKPDVDDLRDYR